MVTNRAAVSCCEHKEMLSVNKTNMIVLKYLGEGICVMAEGIPTKYLRTKQVWECRLTISHESDSCVGMQVPFGKHNTTHWSLGMQVPVRAARPWEPQLYSLQLSNKWTLFLKSLPSSNNNPKSIWTIQFAWNLVNVRSSFVQRNTGGVLWSIITLHFHTQFSKL